MADHDEMNKAVLSSLDVKGLISELEDYMNKPSDYSIIDTSAIFKRCIITLNILGIKTGAMDETHP